MTTARTPSTISSEVSARCRFIASVLQIGMIRAVPFPSFGQHRPIKEIVRWLRESRTTVRKLIRGHATEVNYERGVQPAPKLGEWIEVLSEILEEEAMFTTTLGSLEQQWVLTVHQTLSECHASDCNLYLGQTESGSQRFDWLGPMTSKPSDRSL